MNKLCEGCTSVTGTNMECTLKPRYKKRQCPCITCIVKMVCQANFYSCDIYRDYCLYQNPDKYKKDRPLPCDDCPTCDTCLTQVHELGDKFDIGVEFTSSNYQNMNWILEIKANTFFRDVLVMLQKGCPKLKEYFPYRVLNSSDIEVRVSYPNSYRNQILTYTQWIKRESLLWKKFNVYEIIQKKCPFPEGLAV